MYLFFGIRHHYHVTDAAQILRFHITANDIAELFAPVSPEPGTARTFCSQNHFPGIDGVNRPVTTGTLDFSPVVTAQQNHLFLTNDPLEIP